jgi:hypothetical protein
VHGAGHGDDPRARRLQEQRQQKPGEREVPEVVDPELGLEAVHCAPVGQSHHAGVVDEQIEPLVTEGGHELPYGFKASEVKGRQLDLGVRDFPKDPIPSGNPPLLTPAGKHHMGPPPGQLTRGDKPEPTVGTGHDGDTPALVRDVLHTPAGHDGSFSRRLEDPLNSVRDVQFQASSEVDASPVPRMRGSCGVGGR